MIKIAYAVTSFIISTAQTTASIIPPQNVQRIKADNAGMQEKIISGVLPTFIIPTARNLQDVLQMKCENIKALTSPSAGDIMCLEENGATDRRLAQKKLLSIWPLNFAGSGGYFCVFELLLPNVYPVQKHVRPKLTTAMKSKILIDIPSFSSNSRMGFYMNRGSQSLCKKDNRLPLW